MTPPPLVGRGLKNYSGDSGGPQTQYKIITQIALIESVVLSEKNIICRSLDCRTCPLKIDRTENEIYTIMFHYVILGQH